MGTLTSIGLGLCGILAVVGAGLGINALGMMSRDSRAWRLVSIFVLLVICGSMFVGCETQFSDPFAITMTVNPSNKITSVAISKTPIDLSLSFSREENGVLHYLDDHTREFVSQLPPDPLPVGNTDLVLTPVRSLGGWLYWISPITGHWWLVLRGESLFEFLLSCVAVIVVWGYGLEGQRAWLEIDA